MQALQIIVSGISQGRIFGLIALGFVSIYKATETVDFAQGELMMLGAFLGLTATAVFGLPCWAAVLAARAQPPGQPAEPRSAGRRLRRRRGHDCRSPRCSCSPRWT